MATEVDPVILPAEWEPYVLSPPSSNAPCPPETLRAAVLAWRAQVDPVTKRPNGDLRLYAVLRRFEGRKGEKLIEFAAEVED